MKKMFNKMSNTVKTMICKAHCAMTCARAHLSAPLCNTRGEGYIDTAIKILIAVVLGALLLAGLYSTEKELLDELNMERSVFYDRKREAIFLLSLCLFGYAVPELQEELEMPRLYPD